MSNGWYKDSDFSLMRENPSSDLQNPAKPWRILQEKRDLTSSFDQ